MRCILQPDSTAFPYEPGTNIPCCYDTTPFPQSQINFSITNWVEIIKVDTFCKRNITEGPCCGITTPLHRNNFNLVPSGTRLRQCVAQFNIHTNQYNIYKLIRTNPWKVINTNYDEIATNKTTYFFVNKNLECSVTANRLHHLYTIRLGNKHNLKTHVNSPYTLPTILQLR